MERLAEINSVIFDKTGTLTTGQPRLTAKGDVGADTVALAAAIAMHSRHPYSLALAALDHDRGQITFDAVSEHPGLGLEARRGGDVYRLGRPAWAIADRRCLHGCLDATVALATNGKCVTYFCFDDVLRAEAAEAIAELRRSGAFVEILSGDSDHRVRGIASQLGLTWVAEAQPADKIRHISAFKEAGNKVLMVGDGLNDAPALIAADVSMAPATAADIGRNAADLVFLRDNLRAVPQAIEISRAARTLVRQNFGLAIAYNIVAIPIAILGHVTPLLAAVAMSLSSVMVVANALRLDGGTPQQQARRIAGQAARPLMIGSPR